MRYRLSVMGPGLIVLASAATLAACVAQSAGTTTSQPVARTTDSARPAAPGGVIRRGDTFASMAKQYTARPSPYSATGASAWVEPAPAPAFVASDPPPPADPPAPPLAAVANRQPGEADPTEVARPEAAAPEASAAASQPSASAPDPELRDAGLALFNNFSCGTCHVLADAGASGSIGPSLDRNPRLSKDFTVDVITNGSGAMPSFGGQMTDEEIATLAEYIVQFARK